MKTLFLSPHNDDETLFGAFTLLRYRPHVIVCLRSYVQENRAYGITYQEREAETDAAMKVLGCTWEQWTMPDSGPNWQCVKENLEHLDEIFDVVFAPAYIKGGHEHHNVLGRVATEVFGDHVLKYLTYSTRGKETSRDRVQYELPWIGKKLEALACYKSQYSHPSCQEHFLRDQWEYYS